MSKPKNKSLFYFLFLFLGYCAYYILIGYWLQKAGYYHGQSLFFSEKALIIFHSKESILNILGLTYPALPFIGILPFFPIDPLLAPVIASSVSIALLVTIITWDLAQRKQPRYLVLFIMIGLLLNPLLLYVAVNGSAAAMTVLISYLFFKNLFEYIYSNTTYHISITGLFFALLIFCCYQFIWLSLFILPLILFLALNGMRINASTTGQQLIIAVNNTSLRRKLIGRTYAVFILVFLLPAGGFFLFELLNTIHASQAAYFAESPYANWKVLDEQLFNNKLLTQMSHPEFFASGNFFSLIITPLFIFPVLIPAMYLVRKNVIGFFAIIMLFAYLQFLNIYYPSTIPDAVYYLAFFMVSIICLSFASPIQYLIKNELRIIIPVVLLLTLFTSWIYLKQSPITQERYFTNFLTNISSVDQSNYVDDQKMAEYINADLPKNGKILADDAVAFKVVAFSRQPNHFLLPFQGDFLNAVGEPIRMTKYILININPTTRSFDMLYLKYISGSFYQYYSLEYKTADWLLLKANNS